MRKSVSLAHPNDRLPEYILTIFHTIIIELSFYLTFYFPLLLLMYSIINILLILTLPMEATPNPLFITNSELAQVEAYQKEMINIFRTEYKNL